jgi:4-amino-4-deoxy-L-arabinose transferase-like glycosyltransferase
MIERWSRGWRPYLRLACLSFALFLPGIAALPVLDRDEARFAQATRQMVQTGDFLRIRFQDETRNQKPAGIYWLQAASVAAFGDSESDAIWPYRLPSFVGALVAVLLTFGLGKSLVGRSAALLGAILLASALELCAEAHIAKTDAALLAAILATQGALGAIYGAARAGRTAHWPWALLFWAAQGIAILLKGPIAPGLAVLTAAALTIADRDGGWLKGLRPSWGIPVLLVVACPWFVAIEWATHGGFFADSVGHDLFAKLGGAQESHGAPPLSHLGMLLVGFWPASLFLGPALVHAWRQRRAGPERFLIAWAVPFWILLEIVPTKLPQYLLPVYPALALMSGRAIMAFTAGGWRNRWAELPFVVIWGAVTLALAAALVVLPMRFGNGIDPLALVAAAFMLGLGIAMLVRYRHAPAFAMAAGSALLAFLFVAPAAQSVAPRLDRLFLSRQAAALVRADAGHVHVAAVGYAEPSLVFLLGTDTLLLTPKPAAERLAAGEIGAALVAGDDDARFKAALAERDRVPRALGAVSGLDYSTGKELALTLYESEPR